MAKMRTPLLGKEPDWATFGAYFAGCPTESERQEVEEWIAANPERRAEIARMRMLWERAATVGASTGPIDTAGAWDAMAKTLAPVQAVVQRPVKLWSDRPTAAIRQAQAWQWRALAAVIVVGFVAGVSALRHSRAADAGQTYVAQQGQRRTITLADGTMLTLAPGSQLRLAPDYGRDRRDVYLSGEAYFVVRHNAARPFAVHTTRVVVTDVGTRFDVRSYDADGMVRVAVAEGLVAVGNRKEPLGAGDIAEVMDGSLVVTHGVEVPSLLAWLQGGLTFDNTPMSVVIRELARTFDLSITVADTSLLKRRVTATFGSEPVDVMFDEITAVIGARYQRSGRTVVIRKALGRSARDGRPSSVRDLRTANATVNIHE